MPDNDEFRAIAEAEGYNKSITEVSYEVKKDLLDTVDLKPGSSATLHLRLLFIARGVSKFGGYRRITPT